MKLLPQKNNKIKIITLFDTCQKKDFSLILRQTYVIPLLCLLRLYLTTTNFWQVRHIKQNYLWSFIYKNCKVNF